MPRSGPDVYQENASIWSEVTDHGRLTVFRLTRQTGHQIPRSDRFIARPDSRERRYPLRLPSSLGTKTVAADSVITIVLRKEQ